MEENKIQEAEVEPVRTDDGSDNGAGKMENENDETPADISKENIKPKKRNDLYIELALFLILGFLIGVAVKTEAAERITIGFDDYKMKIFQGGYDINKLQVEQAAKQIEEEKKQQENQDSEGASQPVEGGGSCSAE